jgi:hypothetical protein
MLAVVLFRRSGALLMPGRFFLASGSYADKAAYRSAGPPPAAWCLVVVLEPPTLRMLTMVGWGGEEGSMDLGMWWYAL